MNIVKRVVARHVLALLDIGRGVFTENLKIHRFSDSVRVTDMVNAGKRGKKVRELAIIAGYHNDALKDKILKQAITSIVHMNYDQAKAHLEKIGDTHPGLFTLSETSMRGIDVEPMGTAFNLEKKFPDGEVIAIKASPHEFLVKDSKPIRAEGKPAHGMMQDTLYWNRGKESGIVFYAWMKENLSLAGNMNILELMKVWDSLGVRFDSH